MSPALFFAAILLGLAAAALALEAERRRQLAERLLALANDREAQANAARHVRYVEYVAGHHHALDPQKEYAELIDHGHPVPIAFATAEWTQARIQGNRVKADLAAGRARLVR